MNPKNIFATRFGSAPQPQPVQQPVTPQQYMRPNPGTMPAPAMQAPPMQNPGVLPVRTAGTPGMGMPRPMAPYQMPMQAPSMQAPMQTSMQAPPTFGTAPAPAPGQAPPPQMLNALRQRMGY